MALCSNFSKIINNYYTWLRPTEIKKPECVVKLLESIYPTVNWANVHFYNALPWFIPSSQATAITLPGTYDINQIHIYFDNYNDCDCNGLSVIVHEGYHALQYTDAGAAGIGFIRLFMIQYFGCWLSNGYNEHPMEIAAYEHENLFKACCRTLKDKRICDCKTEPPTFNPDALAELLNNCPNLVKESGGFSYDCGVISAINGFIINILIGVLLPAIEGVLFSVGIVIALVVALGCGLVWLWGQILALLGIICNWSIQFEKKCTQWAQETIHECTQWADQGSNQCAQWADLGSNQCSQWADLGSNQCSQWADQGYSQCSQWADQGYNKCCDWKPCKWFCDALVWISNWVCVATIWISNMVCQAWYWVANMVCQAWYWVANMVCQAWYWVANMVCQVWATIVKWTCLSFTWVIKSITCW